MRLIAADAARSSAVLRRCPRCGLIKEQASYARDEWHSTGYKRICRDCDRRKARAYYGQVRERLLAAGRKPPRSCKSCGTETLSARHVYCETCRARRGDAERQRDRKRDAKRGSVQDRGYGKAHVARRRALEPVVAAGLTPCARCGKRIKPGEPWDLGHVDGERARYNGPEHASCNRAAANRARARRLSRSW